MNMKPTTPVVNRTEVEVKFKQYEDWEQMYINKRKVLENHSLDAEECVRVLVHYLIRAGVTGISVSDTEMIDESVNAE